MKIRRVLAWSAALASLAAASYFAIRLTSVSAAASLPTAPARQGEFLVIARCRGELRARRSVQVNAPVNVPDLRIVWVAAQNSLVKSGDVVVRFDRSSAERQLQEKQAALEQAQATLEQADAEARITAESDRRDLSAASYEVEKARLEVSRQELLSALDAETARVNLGLMERRLSVQKATVALHEASAKSKSASLSRVRDQARYEVELTQQRLGRMEIRSPLDGVIVFQPNYSQGWMNAKPFKVGDQAWPGATIAEIPDLQTLEMEGKLEELDRGKVAKGNSVRIRVDALPELTVPAELADLSAMTQVSFDWPPTYSFRAYARIDKPDPRLRPEMNGTMDVVLERIQNAVSVPAKAVFTRNGKPVVFVSTGKGYSPRGVTVVARNPDEVALSGIQGGAQVALVEPEPAMLAGGAS